MFFVTPNLKYNIQSCIYTVMFILITIIFHAKCLASYCVLVEQSCVYWLLISCTHSESLQIFKDLQIM